MSPPETSLAAFPGAQSQKVVPEFSTPQFYPPGVRLFEQGCLSGNVYSVTAGVVKITSLGLKREEVIIGLRGPGWILGATSAILDQAHETSATTLSACQLQRILATHLRKLLKSNSEISWRIHEIHSWEVRNNAENLAALATQSAMKRLTNLLSQAILGSCSDASAKECVLNIPLRQREIGQLLGITPEHINRLLRTLERAGLIRRNKSRLIIADPKRLIARQNCA